jgi:hypothetical protein
LCLSSYVSNLTLFHYASNVTSQSTDTVFRRTLVELSDHSLITVKRTNGRDYYYIPYADDVIAEHILTAGGGGGDANAAAAAGGGSAAAPAIANAGGRNGDGD